MGATGRPGRPARISREKIVDAAAAAENLDALTMRELAAGLGVTHGALYRWVKNRDELFDLISDVLVERILGGPGPDGPPRPDTLRQIAWAMHDEFLALPGFASHLARPHRHNPDSIGRLRDAVVATFTATGVEPDLAEQSWQIFVTCTVSWLAATEHPLHLGAGPPHFGVFVDTLLRGLPAREPHPGQR